MTITVLMAFAEREDGSILSVEGAANGLSANAVCLDCGTPVMAKQGKVNAWHFAHAVDDGQCKGEGVLHRVAKTTLHDNLHRAQIEGRPFSITWTCYCRQKRRHPNILARVHDIRMEFTYGSIRPDIALLDADDTPIAFIEIVVSHSPTDAVYESGIPVVVVEVGESNVRKQADKGLHAASISTPRGECSCPQRARSQSTRLCFRCKTGTLPAPARRTVCDDCYNRPCSTCGDPVRFGLGNLCQDCEQARKPEKWQKQLEEWQKQGLVPCWSCYAALVDDPKKVCDSYAALAVT